eukprot:CAMPEP_0184493396 /NCGR_PEP_ID=MMETSP0113_2-20130426/25898_1 /TAXON_ID=91329 /ORGANISM="Norrisiella sphaerica, Strain BC52" /LENGTH=798 /DNA_ID=CAMNT_0026878641 /DNA_START=206 /DNA_END=2602 /DNA_ORIENTATION=-
MQLSGNTVRSVVSGSHADFFGIKPGWIIASISGYAVPKGDDDEAKSKLYGLMEKALKIETGMIIEFAVPDEGEISAARIERPTSPPPLQPGLLSSPRPKTVSNPTPFKSHKAGGTMRRKVFGKVVAKSGAYLRASMSLNSRLLKILPMNTEVVITEIRSRRAKIRHPLSGWISLHNAHGETIVCVEHQALAPEIGKSREEGMTSRHVPDAIGCPEIIIQKVTQSSDDGGDPDIAQEKEQAGGEQAGGDDKDGEENEGLKGKHEKEESTDVSAIKNSETKTTNGVVTSPKSLVRSLEKQLAAKEDQHQREVTFLTNCIAELKNELLLEAAKALRTQEQKSAARKHEIDLVKKQLKSASGENAKLCKRIAELETALSVKHRGENDARQSLEKKSIQRASDLKDWTLTVSNLKKLHKNSVEALQRKYNMELENERCEHQVKVNDLREKLHSTEMKNQVLSDQLKSIKDHADGIAHRSKEMETKLKAKRAGKYLKAQPQATSSSSAEGSSLEQMQAHHAKEMKRLSHVYEAKILRLEKKLFAFVGSVLNEKDRRHHETELEKHSKPEQGERTLSSLLKRKDSTTSSLPNGMNHQNESEIPRSTFDAVGINCGVIKGARIDSLMSSRQNSQYCHSPSHKDIKVVNGHIQDQGHREGRQKEEANSTEASTSNWRPVKLKLKRFSVPLKHMHPQKGRWSPRTRAPLASASPRKLSFAGTRPENAVESPRKTAEDFESPEAGPSLSPSKIRNSSRLPPDAKIERTASSHEDGRINSRLSRRRVRPSLRSNSVANLVMSFESLNTDE